MAKHDIRIDWNTPDHIDIYCEDCDLALLCEDITEGYTSMQKVLEANKEHKEYVRNNASS